MKVTPAAPHRTTLGAQALMSTAMSQPPPTPTAFHGLHIRYPLASLPDPPMTEPYRAVPALPALPAYLPTNLLMEYPITLYRIH